MPFINQLYFKFRHSFSSRFPKIYNLCNNRKAVIKFFIAGVAAGGSDLAFLFLFHGVFNWPIVLSTSLAFVLAFLVSFTLQKFWTFRNYSQKKVFGQLFLYLLNAIIGLNINGFLMHLLVNEMSVWYILAQIIVNLLLAFYNFFIYKFVVFRKEPHEDNCPSTTIERSA